MVKYRHFPTVQTNPGTKASHWSFIDVILFDSFNTVLKKT